MKKILFCLQFILITSFTFASDISLFTPSEYAIEAAKLDEEMNDEEFMYFAFAFSEIQENNIPSYMQEYKTLAQKLSTELSLKGLTTVAKGEYILEFLHQNLFKTYREPITKLNNLFNSGVYNCVSSSIVYYALATRFGLPVYGVKTSDHAFCAININGTITDVETTSVYGFNPGEKKEFQNSFGQTGYVYTPPSNYRDRTNIGKTAMLSLILQNAIVELYKTERYETIIRHAVNIHGLLETDGSFDAMVNEFSNYATYLAKRDRYAEGIQFFSSAADYYGKDPRFLELAGILFNNAIATELSYRTIHQLAQKVESAKAFFNTYSTKSIIPRDVVASSKSVLDEATIRVFVEDNSFETSIRETKTYYNQKKISRSMYNDLLMYVYSKEINLFMDSNNWSRALEIANAAVSDTIQDSRAKTQLQAVEHNIGVYYHNQFATLYNTKNYVEAAKKVNEGLKIIPSNRTLLNDRKMLQNLH